MHSFFIKIDKGVFRNRGPSWSIREIIKNAVDINTSTYETPEGIINIKDTYSINYTTIISYLISSLQYTNLKLNLLEEKIKLKLNI